MKCSLRRLHSPDAPALETFSPADRTCFGILIQAMVGPLDGEGEEAFDFVACSPEWLQKNVNSGYRWGRGLLILNEYDYEKVRGAIEALCRSTEGSDWQEIALKLARFLSWEFDGYTPFSETGLM